MTGLLKQHAKQLKCLEGPHANDSNVTSAKDQVTSQHYCAWYYTTFLAHWTNQDLQHLNCSCRSVFVMTELFLTWGCVPSARYHRGHQYFFYWQCQTKTRSISCSRGEGVSNAVPPRVCFELIRQYDNVDHCSILRRQTAAIIKFKISSVERVKFGPMRSHSSHNA